MVYREKSEPSISVDFGAPAPRLKVRSVGEIIRQSYELGVAPDFPLTSVAVDDETGFEVDPYANPTTDRMDLLSSGMAAVHTPPTPAPAPEPAPAPAPAPAE